MPAEQKAASMRLRDEAERFRAAGALGRSDTLRRLFDFILDQSLAGRAPKEIEIAIEVFGRDHADRVVHDAGVRVYVHRLRRKLDAFYAHAPQACDRLIVARGEYRLALLQGESVMPAEPDEPAAPPPEGGAEQPGGVPDAVRAMPRRIWPIVAAVLLVLVAAGGATAGYLGLFERDLTQTLIGSELWHQMRASDKPAFFVIGDRYLLGVAPAYVAPDPAGRAVKPGDEVISAPIPGVPASLNPGSALQASATTQRVLSLIDQATHDHGGRPRLIPMSQFTPEMLKTGDAVYLGFLDGLGGLREGMLASSGFRFGASGDELVDVRDGRRYIPSAGGRQYGYIASLSAPLGNHLILIAATSDDAVGLMAQMVTDAPSLRAISARVGNAPLFEALFEIRNSGALGAEHRLIVVRALRQPAN